MRASASLHKNQALKRAFIVLNPIAGNADPKTLRQAIADHFKANDWDFEIYETTGRENLIEITRKACEEAVDLVIAAGGDGTVAAVVNGIIHKQVPLGIIPAGTGNGLAHALKIPMDASQAIQLITGEHGIYDIDAMQIGERFYILNVSSGISARAMQETEPEQKRKFGILAYIWTILKRVIGIQPTRFNLELDDHMVRVRGTEILVSNGVLIEEPPFPVGPPERFSDHELDVYIITADTFWDHLRVLVHALVKSNRQSVLRHFRVQERVKIATPGFPEPAQADGELIGRTPLEIHLVPGVLPVIVPKQTLQTNHNSRRSA
jgi:YegS/Rv2252/BmrU family lipid kinase